MKAYSLRTRLFFYSMVFCFTGVVLVGVYSYIAARKALIQRTYQQLISLKEEKRARIESFFFERERDVNFISSSSDLLSLIEKIRANNSKGAINQEASLNPDLVKYLSNAKAYSSISIGLPNGLFHLYTIDSSGRISGYFSSSLQSVSLDSLFQETLKRKQIVIKDFSKGITLKDYSLFISSPLYDRQGQFLGVIFLEVPDNVINAIMSEHPDVNGIRKTGEVYLVGSDFLLRSTSRFIDKPVLSISANFDSIKKALRGNNGIGKTIDYRGQKVLSSFGPLSIKNLRWAIISEMDYQEATQQVSVLGSRILLISFIVLLFLTVGVFILYKRITAPIIILKEAAIKVGDGKFDQMLPVMHRDEIGLLTQVFNKMILQIKQMTSSLLEREQRLTHFYKATIDGIVLYKSNASVLVNHALSALTGYSEEELLKKSPLDYILTDDDIFMSSQQDSNFSFEAILKTKSDYRIPVEVQRNRVLYHGQEVDALVIRDISQRKAIEAELQSERLRQMRSVIDGQEQERQRLSRELHDGLGQTLVGIKLKLESIPLEELGNQAKTIESVKQMFNQTIEETRRISNNLMPAALTEFSLAVVLRNLCMEVESNSGISVSLVTGVLPDSFSLLLKTYVYRISQEALNNIVKHSGAKRAVISIYSDISKLYLNIEDDGDGFDPSKGFEQGNGLYNMKERVTLLNGKFDITAIKGGGVKISAEFPIFPKTKT